MRVKATRPVRALTARGFGVRLDLTFDRSAFGDQPPVQRLILDLDSGQATQIYRALHKILGQSAVLAEIQMERDAQEAKWGEQNHPWLRSIGPWASIDNQASAKEYVDALAQSGMLDYAGILTEEYHEALEARTPAEVRAELVQVAAVAVAAIESIDRNGR